MATTDIRPERALLLSVLAALLLYAAHAALVGAWIVDDAGISFAYARSLAQGHGLVAQPGAPPVEGFSNPLWTLLLSAFFAAGLFHPVLVPKLLALSLVGGTYAMVAWEVRRAGARDAVALLAPALLSATAPFVLWTASGLENALLAILAAASCALARRALTGAGGGVLLAAGLCAGLLALTRPDGVVYAAAAPAALLAGVRARRVPVLRVLPGLFRLGAAFALPVAAWQAVRLAWFGDVLPNTYYAKGGPSLASLLDVAKAFDLLSGGVGPAFPLALGLVGAGVVLSRGRRDGFVVMPALHALLAAGAYVLLPADWMGEYRFATPFFVFLAWSVAEAVAAVAEAAAPRARGPALVWLAAASLALATAATNVPRTLAFARDPTVPFAWIRALGGDGFGAVARAAHVSGGSVLLPDVGGALYASRLRVHDLAGLCDRTTARTIGADAAAFRDYVFVTLRPTFVHVHGVWAERAALHDDPRLARDYVVLRETWTRPGSDAPPGREPWAAAYVRRDALAGSEIALADARRAYREAGLDALGPWPRPDAFADPSAPRQARAR